MVPSAYVKLDALPLNPNGKLDRKALPAPDSAAFNTRTYAPPEGHIEETLARIWAELLHLEQVGRFDHFFELLVRHARLLNLSRKRLDPSKPGKAAP